jgi:hypothetical protein
MTEPELNFEEIADYIDNIPDDVLSRLQFAVPWQYSPTSTASYKDPDGAPLYPQDEDEEGLLVTRRELQKECWRKFNQNPQVNTSVRGLSGRITGRGFETTSEIFDIQKIIGEIETDPRNRLYNFWPKYVARSNIEGELFKCLTCHRNGFIEVDFIDPSSIDEGGDDDTGIIFHPDKKTMPLFYNVTLDGKHSEQIDQIPSIYVARYPELISVARNHENFKKKDQKKSISRAKVFKKLGGYYRFIISWDKGFITRRATSYLKTTLQWLNYYEMLKEYEIDHKKSVGSYVWVFSIENPRDFRLWLSMTDDQRKKTGIAAKKTPGSTLVLPPGVKCEVKSPQLPSIKDEDTDIMQMAISGLNEPADVTTGTAKGTFASVKASRGPMSDRISDEIAYFDRYVKHDFWSSVFFLKSVISNFPTHFKRREAVRFDKDSKPIFESVKRRPEELIEISYPISEIADFESRAKGLLGVKHGPISGTLGIPNRQVADALGFGSYGRNRLRKATEDENYPELIYAIDAESLQEKVEAEPPIKKTKKKKAKEGEENA